MIKNIFFDFGRAIVGHPENVEGSEACGKHGFVFKGDAKAAERFIYEN